MNLQTRLGMALFKRRDELGLTQKALAAKARVSPTTIQDIESGSRNVRLSTVEVLAIGLGMTGKTLLEAAIAEENAILKGGRR